MGPVLLGQFSRCSQAALFQTEQKLRCPVAESKLSKMFNFTQEEFAKLARMDFGKILDTYQGSQVIVLGLEISGTPLTTLCSIPPTGHYFGQDWWLGQAYWDWYLTAGFDESLVEAVLSSLKRSRISIKGLPTNFINLRGGFTREQGSKLTVWDTSRFQTITIPTTSVNCVLNAFESSFSLLKDSLILQRSSDVNFEVMSYGETQFERAFSTGLPDVSDFHGTAYRNPMMQMLAKHNVKLPEPSPAEQKVSLRRLIDDLNDVVSQSSSDRMESLRAIHKWQYFYMLDARDFAPDLAKLVVKVNTLRAQVLMKLSAPHFFSTLTVRLLDVSLNTQQKKYRYVPNDRDWLIRLQEQSPGSFSPNFEELANVDAFIVNMKERYSCLADDLLQGTFPKCAVHAF